MPRRAKIIDLMNHHSTMPVGAEHLAVIALIPPLVP
jgi:hypothetical protein